MRIETIEKEVYTFNELSKEAKEKVKQWYLEGQEACIFTDIIVENLNYLFPNSDLKVEYSLNYCQGDGLNIYGKLNIIDMFEKLNISEENKNEILNIIDYDNNLELSKHNNSYGYSLKFKDIKEIDSYIYDICSKEYKEDEKEYKIAYDFIYKVLKYMEDLDKDNENAGYNYFYEISEEDLKEICENNNYEFLKDGTIY